MQGNQGIANVGQRLVQLLDGALQSVVGGDEGGKIKTEEGDGLAARAQQQPAQQRGEDQEAIERQVGEFGQLEHQGGELGHDAR